MSDMNFSIEEELPIILVKEYKLNSNIKGHAYISCLYDEMEPGEFLKA